MPQHRRTKRQNKARAAQQPTPLPAPNNPTCPTLNFDIITLIFQMVSKSDLIHCARVSKLWHEASVPLIYRHVFIGRPLYGAQTRTDHSLENFVPQYTAHTRVVTIFPHAECLTEHWPKHEDDSYLTRNMTTIQIRSRALFPLVDTVILDVRYDTITPRAAAALYVPHCPIFRQVAPRSLVIRSKSGSGDWNSKYRYGHSYSRAIKTAAERITFVVDELRADCQFFPDWFTPTCEDIRRQLVIFPNVDRAFNAGILAARNIPEGLTKQEACGTLAFCCEPTRPYVDIPDRLNLSIYLPWSSEENLISTVETWFRTHTTQTIVNQIRKYFDSRFWSLTSDDDALNVGDEFRGDAEPKWLARLTEENARQNAKKVERLAPYKRVAELKGNYIYVKGAADFFNEDWKGVFSTAEWETLGLFWFTDEA